MTLSDVMRSQLRDTKILATDLSTEVLEVAKKVKEEREAKKRAEEGKTGNDAGKKKG